MVSNNLLSILSIHTYNCQAAPIQSYKKKSFKVISKTSFCRKKKIVSQAFNLPRKGAPKPRPKYKVILMARPALFLVLKGMFYFFLTK